MGMLLKFVQENRIVHLPDVTNEDYSILPKPYQHAQEIVLERVRSFRQEGVQGHTPIQLAAVEDNSYRSGKGLWLLDCEVRKIKYRAIPVVHFFCSHLTSNLTSFHVHNLRWILLRPLWLSFKSTISVFQCGKWSSIIVGKHWRIEDPWIPCNPPRVFSIITKLRVHQFQFLFLFEWISMTSYGTFTTTTTPTFGQDFGAHLFTQQKYFRSLGVMWMNHVGSCRRCDMCWPKSRVCGTKETGSSSFVHDVNTCWGEVNSEFDNSKTTWLDETICTANPTWRSFLVDSCSLGWEPWMRTPNSPSIKLRLSPSDASSRLGCNLK